MPSPSSSAAACKEGAVTDADNLIACNNNLLLPFCRWHGPRSVDTAALCCYLLYYWHLDTPAVAVVPSKHVRTPMFAGIMFIASFITMCEVQAMYRHTPGQPAAPDRDTPLLSNSMITDLSLMPQGKVKQIVGSTLKDLPLIKG
eukprot:GHRQ01021914.1.p1 GENE.GHRQ01021914.1~~GHRQ01021914.1.p1  ORF type:complete len:144 (-),score=6.98 GHRQ01021914.1:529-960(-)